MTVQTRQSPDANAPQVSALRGFPAYQPDEAPPDSAISFAVVARVARGLDVAMLAGTAAAADIQGWSNLPTGQAVLAALIFAYVATSALSGVSAYRSERLGRFWVQIKLVAAAAVLGTLGLAVGVWLVHGDLSGQIAWMLRVGMVGMLVVLVARLGVAVLLALWRAQGRLTRNVAIIGANDYSRSFIETVRADRASDMRIIGIYDDRLARIGPSHADVPVQGTVATLIEDSRMRRIDVIVVALPLGAAARIEQVRRQLAPTVADIFLTADTAGLRYSGRDFEALGANGVIRVGSRPLSDWEALCKSMLDRAGAAAGLLLLSPLLLGVALAIRWDSPGPVLFRQPRIGFNNNPFVVLKFRTMYRHMADLKADRQTTRDDPRVTRLGRFLRRSSIDELPQLANVLMGDMSLVGPRPHAPNTKAANRFFDEVVADYALRHRIKPGLTGWAQVNGWRGETATIEQIEQRVAHDLSYIENWSLLLDIKILFMTVFKGFGGANAY